MHAVTFQNYCKSGCMQLGMIIVMSGTGSVGTHYPRRYGFGKQFVPDSEYEFLSGCVLYWWTRVWASNSDEQVPVAISVTAVRLTSVPLCSCDTNLDDLAPARIDGAMLGPAKTLFGITPTDSNSLHHGTMYYYCGNIKHIKCMLNHDHLF